MYNETASMNIIKNIKVLDKKTVKTIFVSTFAALIKILFIVLSYYIIQNLFSDSVYYLLIKLAN